MSWTVIDDYAASVLNSLALLLASTLLATVVIAGFGYLLRPRSNDQIPNFGSLISAFTLLGTVTGVIAGASQEGLVSALLTGMLGIVSSLLAFSFGKDALAEFRPIFSHTLIVLLLAALTGLIIGSAFRAFGDRDKRDQADYRTTYDQVWAPVERERRLQLLKSCLEASPTFEAKRRCS